MTSRNMEQMALAAIVIDRMDGSPVALSGGFVSFIDVEYDMERWNDNNIYRTELGPGVTVKLYFPNGITTQRPTTTGGYEGRMDRD